jgi:predicted ATP-grasp superfamily ATP-dependent carboligase
LSSIEIVELSEIPVKKRTVVTGFAGAGFIGNTALMYAARVKGYRQVGHLRGDAMPPMMILSEGRPAHSFRIYTDASDAHMFLVTESMLQGDSAWAIGRTLMGWLKKKGVKEIVSLEGFPFAQKGVYGFTTGGKNLLGLGVQPIMDGAISGVNASLLDEAIRGGVEWTTIFVPTRLISSVDYQGTVDAIQVLNTMLGLDVDPEQLRGMSEAVAKATEAHRQQQRKRGGFLDRIISGESGA